MSIKAIGLVALAIILVTASVAPGALFNVAVNGTNFSPSNLTIMQGDQVRWFWNGGTSHTTTHVPSAGQTKLWDQPITSNAATDEFTFTFNVTAGVYNYKCTPHAFTGKVTVQTSSGILDDPGSEGDLPNLIALRQNSPNPFNAATQIEYGLDKDEIVQLAVYNILGQLVATLVDGFQPGGLHTVTWDGRNDHGNETPSGIYFARLTTVGVMMTRKMVLLR